MTSKTKFMELVQLHERVWGTDTYPNRPSLEAILSSPVVTFWLPIKEEKHRRYRIKLFATTKEIEQYYSKLVFRAHVQPPRERLTRIYVKQKPVIVSGVKFLFQELQE